ncbi:hypothetical protein M9434_002955 [Picochlorum sp. BPE23]|nr:hypothetical protein M9434_002955 [Picochlorum sp. BPE23]
MTLYDVLELEATASAEDVRRAYRKLALKWHPDKQIQESGDENFAADKFREIQNAYEILTDEKERNSYDARLRRLQKKTGSTNQTCAPPETFTEVADLLFDREYMEFPTNIGAYGDLFLKIASLETTHYPDFFLNGDEPIQTFYAEWGSFATSLNFEWVQQPIDPRLDRRIRRAIEQENVKTRKTARREYNEQVRLFAEFVKKRDSRYKEYQSMLLEKKRQQEEQAAAAAAAAAELKIQRREMNLNLSISDDDQESEEDIFEQQLWHCPACEKFFKSEGAFTNHEKSKKHNKNVEILRQTLLLEEEDDDFGGFENLTISSLNSAAV